MKLLCLYYLSSLPKFQQNMSKADCGKSDSPEVISNQNWFTFAILEEMKNLIATMKKKNDVSNSIKYRC